MAELHGILNEQNLRPPATDQDIGDAETSLGLTLPADYVEFLKLSDGYAGFIGDATFLDMWPVSDLATRNREYGVETYAPGLLAIGSDGGGEMYGFDTRSGLWSIVQVPFVPMNWESAQAVAPTFYTFLTKMAEER